jgi:tetratricopeptide (TPR) repeat protein
VEGFFISRSFFHIKPMTLPRQRGTALRPRAYEGKHITIRGWLYPGDRFVVEPGTVRIIGACRLRKKPRFQNTLAWAHRTAARAFTTRGRLADALRHINRAIQIKPKVYAFYLTRARIKLQRKQRRAALADARRALTLAQDNTERAWCNALILQIAKSK